MSRILKPSRDDMPKWACLALVGISWAMVISNIIINIKNGQRLSVDRLWLVDERDNRRNAEHGADGYGRRRWLPLGTPPASGRATGHPSSYPACHLQCLVRVRIIVVATWSRHQEDRSFIYAWDGCDEAVIRDLPPFDGTALQADADGGSIFALLNAKSYWPV